MRVRLPSLFGGALALVAGFGLARSGGAGRDSAGEGRAVFPDGLTAGGGDEVKTREGTEVHPALLRKLRRLEGLANGRWHASLGVADFPDALFAAQDEFDYAAMDSLFRRWAEIDREGMVRHFLARGEVTLPSGNLRYDDLSASLFQALALADPREAARVALRFPKSFGYMNRALSAIAETAPELAVELALEHLGQWEATGGLDLRPEGNMALARAMAGRENFGKEERNVFQGLLRNGQPKIREDIWHALSPEEQAQAVVAFVPGKKDAGAVEREVYEVYRTRIESGLPMGRSDMNHFFSYCAGSMIMDGGTVEALDWVEKFLGSEGIAAGADDLLATALQQGESIQVLAAEYERLSPGPAKAFLKAWLGSNSGGK